MKRLILGMSYSRSVVRNNISSKAAQIDEHFICLCLYPHSDEVDHWKSEIVGFLHQVDRLKGSNKFPNRKFILECLQGSNDRLGSMIRYVTKKEKTLKPLPILDRALLDQLCKYQDWLASELSDKGEIDVDSAYEILSTISGCD